MIIDWDYSDFKEAFYRRTGLDLNLYKDKQMERRIRQLMQREDKSGFRELFNYLSASAAALEFFLNYLTINTSEFFRDQKVYSLLQREIFPEIMHSFQGKMVVWSAGCSIGAEPYTVAIILHQLQALSRWEIIATDMDDKALLTAQQGCYNIKQLGRTPAALLEAYFSREKELYCIKPEIREAVRFRQHNMLTDDPIPRCHILFCRNVFIYFKPQTQHFLLERFSRIIVPGGFIVIGSAEYIANSAQYSFTKRHNTIFQKV